MYMRSVNNTSNDEARGLFDFLPRCSHLIVFAAHPTETSPPTICPDWRNPASWAWACWTSSTSETTAWASLRTELFAASPTSRCCEFNSEFFCRTPCRHSLDNQTSTHHTCQMICVRMLAAYLHNLMIQQTQYVTISTTQIWIFFLSLR